jgi:hypothetical protein
MKWSVAFIAAAGLWLGAAGASAETKRPPPVEAFGRVPAIDSVALSPNGQRLAWVDSSGSATMIEIFDLEKGATVKRVNAPVDLKLRGLDWADDEILLVHGSLTKAVTLEDSKARAVEWFRTVALDLQSGKASILLHQGDTRNNVTAARLLSLRTRKPKTVVMSSWDFSMVNYRQETGSRLTGGRKDDGWTYNVYEVDTLSGVGKLVNAGTPFTSEWVLDANGEAAARTEWEPQRKKFTVLHGRGSNWNDIYSVETDSPPALLGLSRDGPAVLMMGAVNSEHIGIWRLPVDGSAPQLAIGDEANDITDIVLDPYSQDVLGAWVGGIAPGENAAEGVCRQAVLDHRPLRRQLTRVARCRHACLAVCLLPRGFQARRGRHRRRGISWPDRCRARRSARSHLQGARRL